MNEGNRMFRQSPGGHGGANEETSDPKGIS